MPDGGVIAARLLSYAALLLVAGLPLYLLCAGGDLVRLARWRLVLILLAALALAASVWWALAGIAAMAALPLSGLDQATIVAVLQATPLGGVLAIRLILLLGVALAVLAPWPRWRLPVAALCGGAALATCAWTGHAGASAGTLGSTHRLADILHLLAASTWLGALLVLFALVLSPAGGPELHRRLAGFTTIGTVCVVALLGTGIVNTLAITGVGGDFAWVTSRWGTLLAIKVALFAAMLALAAMNRWRLAPALAGDRPRAWRHLRWSLALETLAGMLIVAIVALLGTLDPAG